MAGDRSEPITWAQSWIAVAWVLACLQTLLEVAARRAEFAAGPALAGYHVALMLAAVLIGALTIGRSSGSRVAAALACTLAIVGARMTLSTINPTISWLLPVALVAPVALSVEIASWPRVRQKPDCRSIGRVSTSWWVVAAAWLVSLSVLPHQWEGLGIDQAELRTAAWSIVAAALAALIAAAIGRHASDALRAAVAGTCGALAYLSVPAAGIHLPRSIVAAALGVLLAAATASATVNASLVALPKALGRGYTSVASGACSAGSRIHSGLSLLLRTSARGWRDLLERSAPQQPTLRPAITTADRVGASFMALSSCAFMFNGASWAHRAGWQPGGHAATILARAADVGTANHPLLGTGTSLGRGAMGAHPGPLLMDVLAPFVRTFGLQDGALVGGVLVGLACWTVAVWAAWRAAGRVAAIAAWAGGAMVLEIAALGAVWEANNVSITLLAMFAAVMTSWAAAAGTWRAWWWAVGLGSLCAQSYMPHTLIVLGPVLWAGLAVAGAARSAAALDDRRRARNALRIGWLVVALAWAQPLLEMAINQGGNVRALFELVPNGPPTVGLLGALHAVAWILTLPPRWGELTGSIAETGDATDFLGGSMLVGALVVAVLGAFWWRTRSSTPSNERQLRIVAVLVLAGAALNSTMLPADHLRIYQLGWLVVASLFLWFTVAVSIAFAMRTRITSDEHTRWAAHAPLLGLFGAIAIVAVLSAESPRSIAEVKGRPYTIDPMIDPLVNGVVEATPDGEQMLVLALDSRFNEAATDTIISNLIVRGRDVLVEQGTQEFYYGRQRSVDDDWTGQMLWITAGVTPIKPDGSLVASAEMPDWSRAEFDRLAARVGDAARTADPVVVEPRAVDLIPRYLAGWVDGDVCKAARDLLAGRRKLSSLPDGLLLTLYGEQAIRIPGLDRSVAEDAAAAVGQGPIEIWRVDRNHTGKVDSKRLLRDGSECP